MLQMYPLITNQRRRAVVGHFQNDLDLLPRFVRRDETGLVQGIAVGDRHGRRGGIGVGVLPPLVGELVAVGIGGGGGELHGFTGFHVALEVPCDLGDGRVVGILEISSRTSPCEPRSHSAPPESSANTSCSGRRRR